MLSPLSIAESWLLRVFGHSSVNFFQRSYVDMVYGRPNCAASALTSSLRLSKSSKIIGPKEPDGMVIVRPRSALATGGRELGMAK